ncbi:hypothetical protein SK854_45680 [Lentzea sp. BCCO 10_0061]|uniref:Uncharacterized protein n=1 Tax=Lentzea sokolovensis TaxID=3095429 RepID=A0ABU4VCI6_9PSEU|nr:hypothetical protein [Lentzea sp. BCCO 10_0061]MDX8149482.1 hypothetical protein [Lentzea sp. BCCO 10_0061]
MRSARSTAVESAAAWYRDCHFWPVQVRDDDVFLPLGRGTVAFDVPAQRAARVQEVLERNDIHTAALHVEQPVPRVTFLGEADDTVFGQFQMPPGVRYLTVPFVLRLPLMTMSFPDNRKWFCSPDPARRWFPRAAALLAAVTAATPYALRACRAPVPVRGRERVLIG